MGVKMTSDIKETTYEHVDGEKTFTITAAERWSITMVHRLKEKHPDEVQIMHTNKDGSMVARFPAAWMRIRAKRTVVMTDAQRAAAAARMERVRAKKS